MQRAIGTVRRFIFVSLWIVVVGFLSGCSPTRILASMTPSGGATITEGISYGSGERRKLDIYVPHGAKNAPVIVFFYGGSWQSGSRDMYRFVGNAFAARGIVAVIADYRVYPDVKYPEFIEDSARAVAWAHENAALYGGDPGKLFVSGHSAGAYNAAMLVMDRGFLAAYRLDLARDIKGFIGISGPYDFLPLRDDTLKTIFGPEEGRKATQPVNRPGNACVPSLLMTGTGDTTVAPKNSHSLARVLKARGCPVDVKLYRGIGHIGTVAAISRPLRFHASVFDDTVTFIQRETNR